MFLLCNAIIANLDGIIIGVNLRLAKIKLTKENIKFILIGSTLIYAIFLLLYYYLKLNFMSKTISTFLYLFLAWNSLKDKEKKFEKELTKKECLLITTSHALDGALVSLNFVYNYPLINIITLFSFMTTFILLFGYFCGNIWKSKTKNTYLISFLFVLLAILNIFF